MKKLLLGTEKELTGTLFLIGVQQALAAAATVVIAYAITTIQSGADAKFWIVAAMSGMMAPYIPGLLAKVSARRWNNALLKAWTNLWLERHHERLDLLSDTPKKERGLSLLLQEAPAVIQQSTSLVSDTVSLSLNFLFQWVALGVFYSPVLSVYLGCGILLSGVLILRREASIKSESLDTNACYSRLSSHLLGAWEAATQNNPVASTRWRLHYRNYHSEWAKQSVKLEVAIQNSTGLALIALFGPLLLGFVCAAKGDLDTKDALMIAAALPRVLQTLQSGMNAVHCLLNLKPLVHRWNDYLQSLPESPSRETIETQLMERISERLRAIALAEVTTPATSGRLTLSASNGAGKSSSLLLLKLLLGSEAFYFGPGGEGLLPNAPANVGEMSTGQTIRNRVRELLENPPAKTILLDEWDAHLDDEHTRRLDQLIADRSKSLRIIEVRHA